jgi:membrane fusion protein (multidrug efflux system)
VFTYSGGKVQMNEITTGVRDSTRVEVVTGLKSGDTMITSAILFLRPGMEVDRIDTIQ